MNIAAPPFLSYAWIAIVLWAGVTALLFSWRVA